MKIVLLSAEHHLQEKCSQNGHPDGTRTSVAMLPPQPGCYREPSLVSMNGRDRMNLRALSGQNRVRKDSSPGLRSGTTSAYLKYTQHDPMAETVGTSRRMVTRQHPRFPASFSGTLIHESHLHQISKALDLSCKGCRLESPFRASAGMKVDLLLYIPEADTPILIQGAVIRWSGAHGIGIEFQSLTSPHQERLEGTIRQLETAAGHS